jgi:hypothetical protein
MLKNTLLAAVFTAVTCASAFAGVTVSADKRTVFAPPGNTSRPVIHMHLPKKSKTIYSNLASAYPNGLYFSGEGDTLCGPTCALGESISVAGGFTPTAAASASSVSAAVGYIEGPNEFTIAIYSDTNGVPGTVLASGVAAPLPTFGDCCGLATVKFKKPVALTAGTPYWVVATADSNESATFAAWNLATVDQVDAAPVSYNDNGAGWTSYTSTLPPAFAVYAK